MSERERLKIQDQLPLRTVGIETQRERKDFTHLPPQNYLHVWFARRPTPATRLSILSSVLPEDVDNDTLLRWMGINPVNKSQDRSIDQHVRDKKLTEDSRDGAEYEHYGYRKIWRWTPSEDIRSDIHDKVSDAWNDRIPRVLDATAGGGSIPFESVRYGFSTTANELNPVASIILKAVLEHPRVDGDLSNDIELWGDKINERARDTLSEYYPSKQGEKNLAYLWAHSAICPDCGFELPLTPNWWLDKENASEGVAVKPNVEDDSDSVNFSIIELPNQIKKSDFNPTDGTVSYGKATCLRCGVTIDSNELKSQAQGTGLGYELYAVYYEDRFGERSFRSPNSEDIEAHEKAVDKIENDVELATFLTEDIPSGEKTDELRRNGITSWRDTFSPKQLLTHYAYLAAYREVKPEIQDRYDESVADAILTFLSIAADKALDYNNRMSAWDPTIPKIAHSFERHNFAFKWSFAENNLIAEDLGYDWVIGNVLKAYNDLHDLSGDSPAEVDVYQSDAQSLPLDKQSIDAVVLDPPYYDNVMYAELSDFFYVWQKEYLSEIYPHFFNSNLTDKDSEAVANPSRFDDIAGESQSVTKLANQDYEEKMTGIFSEVFNVLNDDGIFTLMFTHKKTEAWDTLTTALIEAGFVVTATHPISTENPNSLHQMGKNAAESTILLASEKRQQDTEEYTLWSDIQKKTQSVAATRARELDERDVDFAKVDIILASFGPTLEIFTEKYPVVDDEGNDVSPQTALDEARVAVRDYFIGKYLNENVRDVDPRTEWYILSWLVFEAQRFPYDEARRLAIGVGEDLDTLKKTHRMWRKRSGDVLLRPHGDRVQNINKDRDNRSGRKPVDPDALSFATALDKVHAAMHIYDAKGATEAWNWMNDRNCGSDPSFKATLEALLRVLPHDHSDWELARNLAAGETGDLLDLDLDADIFRDSDDEENRPQANLNDF
jgi:putative DNA methylase